MAGFRIEGNVSGNVAEVDVYNNLKVTLPNLVAQAGYVKLAGDLSESTDPAGLLVEELRVSAQGRLSMGQPVPLLNEIFNYTTLNTALFFQTVVTQTVTVGGGTLNLNASAINTLTTSSSVKTYQMFPLFADMATYMVCDMSLSAAPQTNCTIELGMFQFTGVTAPTDGVMFRWDSTGVLKAVLNNNGTEYTSAALTNPSTGVMHKYKIICENDRVLFYIDGACQAVIASPTGLGMPTYTPSQPFSARIYHAGTAPALANQPKIGYVYIGQQDARGIGRDSATVAAAMGRMGSQLQPAAAVSGSTALYTNSLAPGAGAVMTNTTAALGTGLGGQFSVLPTLAANTDGILCSYLNPAAAVGVPGKTLYIRGVWLQGSVTTVLVGNATPVIYAFSLSYGGNALTLATAADTIAGVKASRRVPLGYESYAAAAALGTLGQGVYRQFAAPIAVNPSEYVQIAAKNVGVVTTTGVITFLVGFDAYWE